MDPITPEYARLRSIITECLNAHDPAAIMDHGRPGNEYAPEMEDFAALIAGGEPVTAEVVAAVWHKRFGDSQGSTAGEPGPPTAGMAALATELQDLQRAFVQYWPPAGVPGIDCA